MAQHWSALVGVTEKQAYALDRMAREAGLDDGMDLLMKVSGCSRSKIGRLDRLTLRQHLDTAFEQYGR